MMTTPTDARPVGGGLRLGHIFSSTWAIFSANFLKFFAIGLAAALPSLLLQLTETTEASVAGTPFAAEWRGVVGSLLSATLSMMAQAAVLYIAFQYLRGRPASIGEGIQKGLARLFPVLGVVILFFVGVFIGFIFIIPGIFLLVRWSVAVPVCMVESLGPVASLRRSAALTKGHGWGIFGISVLIWVGLLVSMSIVESLSRPLGAIAGALAEFLLAGIWTAYFSSLWVMIYHDLRVEMEGVDIDQIASVFD